MVIGNCIDCGKQLAKYGAKRCKRCALLGHKTSIKTRNKISNSQKGYHNSIKTEFKKGHKVPKEWREKMSLKKLGKPSPMKGKGHTKEAKEKNRKAHLGKKLSRNHIKSISKSHKKKFSNKKFVREFGLRFCTKPNKPEKIMIKIIKENNFPFNYTGDGSVWFKGKNYCFNPDFLSKNPKYIIEIYGNYWHNLSKNKKKDKERINTYKRYGYKTLIIWDYELKNTNKIIPKINSFINF